VSDDWFQLQSVIHIKVCDCGFVTFICFSLWLIYCLKYGLLIIWPLLASRTVVAIYETHELVPACV
jgi:hypothetical protein